MHRLRDALVEKFKQQKILYFQTSQGLRFFFAGASSFIANPALIIAILHIVLVFSVARGATLEASPVDTPGTKPLSSRLAGA
ncbi:hypothetical protein [Stappia sp. ES.058]|uniref:hypothetical protein n=1 Tax=Stappia sp. ES.058 TaxID=1881061 RepID=UPI00087A9CB4|nr:hypothetical protein [Stappia sp. ES.058]SDU38901.1 hypothetical protein SAMN05428979_3404 [Stappia sp. ES.058]